MADDKNILLGVKNGLQKTGRGLLVLLAGKNAEPLADGIDSLVDLVPVGDAGAPADQAAAAAPVKAAAGARQAVARPAAVDTEVGAPQIIITAKNWRTLEPDPTTQGGQT